MGIRRAANFDGLMDFGQREQASRKMMAWTGNRVQEYASREPGVVQS